MSRARKASNATLALRNSIITLLGNLTVQNLLSRKFVTLLVQLLYSPILDTFSGFTSAPTRGLVVTITTPSAVQMLTLPTTWFRPLFPTNRPSQLVDGTH